MTTCLENLEMSGNLTAVREMSGILLKFGEMLWKSCLKLCIVSCIFASIQVFSTSMGMIQVTLNMPSAANRKGISHCLESGHPDYFTFVTSRCSVHCSVAYLGVIWPWIVALFFRALFYNWTVKMHVPRLLVTVRVFCLLKTVSKWIQSYHFGDKNDFHLGGSPAPSSTPHPHQRLALPPPYWNPKYATVTVV